MSTVYKIGEFEVHAHDGEAATEVLSGGKVLFRVYEHSREPSPAGRPQRSQVAWRREIASRTAILMALLLQRYLDGRITISDKEIEASFDN